MMTRRGLFGILSALPFLFWRPRCGAMTIERWHAEGHFGKRVFLNGVEITDRCRWFDDELGVAECFTPDFQINPVTRHAVIQRLQGRIEVRA